jgi:hypothetical protein
MKTKKTKKSTQPKSNGQEQVPESTNSQVENQQAEAAPSTAAPKKEKAPSISASVRRIVVRRPQLTSDEVSKTLVEEGWDVKDVEKRKSTIATLRTDALAIIGIAKEEGCWKQ